MYRGTVKIGNDELNGARSFVRSFVVIGSSVMSARRNEGTDPAARDCGGSGGQHIALSASFGSLDLPDGAGEQVGVVTGVPRNCLQGQSFCNGLCFLPF